MDWKQRLGTNPSGLGDPVTALYLPSGFVVASGFTKPPQALRWIERLAFGNIDGGVAAGFADESLATIQGLAEVARRFERLNQAHEEGLRRYDPDAAKPLIAGLRIHMSTDSLQLHAFRAAPFRSYVTLTIRPHHKERDGKESGPPLIGVEWGTVGPNRDEALLLPEALGPSIRRSACAWTDTTMTGLTTVTFEIASPAPFDVPRRWSLRGIEWPNDQGGAVCFGGTNSVGYLVTLPKELAPPLIQRVGEGDTEIYGGTSHYLDEIRPSQHWQNL